MAINKTLLATVALPLLSLSFTFQPAVSATVRPIVTIEQDQSVVMVAMSLKEARARLRAARQALAEAKASGGDVEGAQAAVAAARAEVEAAQAAGGAGNQDDSQQTEQPKKKKQQQAEEPAMEETVPAEEQVTPAKKPKRQTPAADAADDAGDVNIEDPQPNDNANEDAAEQPVKKKKKQVQAVDDTEVMEPAADASEASAPAAEDDEAIKLRRAERRKLRQQQLQEEGGVEKQKEVAKDPSKSTDTVVLPVEGGAAVLDSEKEADAEGDATTRAQRRKLREQAKEVAPPKSDADAQVNVKVNIKSVLEQPVLKEEGKRIREKPGFDQPDGRRVGTGDDVRIVFKLDNRVVVRSDDRDRIALRAQDVYFDQLANGRTRQVVIKPDGTKIVTVRNRYGEIIRRSRVDPRGVEIIIFFSPELDRGGERLYLRDAGFDLPPMRLRIPVEDYIIDVSGDPDRDYREFLAAPPVERVERVYSVDEVKYSARIRDKVRRIDLDTLTFATGSAEISVNQAQTLRKVADAILALLDEDPGETFLIEGHTDAVGSDESNLVLSDMRAEAVAGVLSEVYDIPAENLTTQGYGERFLKIDTDDEERANRRVTIRRITSLVRPPESASAE